jgi:hypothetical protein
MKFLIALVLLIPSLLVAQQSAALAGPVTLEIRSADSSRVSNVDVRIEGRLFGSLGVLLPAPGKVSCGPTGCVATTPALLELTRYPGEGRISVATSGAELEVSVVDSANPKSRMIARGHSITFTRTDQGELKLSAPSIRTLF